MSKQSEEIEIFITFFLSQLPKSKLWHSTVDEL